MTSIRWSARFASLLVGVWLALGVACSSEDGRSGDGSCADQETAECACTDGRTGTQLCQSAAWGTCDCDSAAGGGTGATTSGGASSGGSTSVPPLIATGTVPPERRCTDSDLSKCDAPGACCSYGTCGVTIPSAGSEPTCERAETDAALDSSCDGGNGTPGSRGCCLSNGVCGTVNGQGVCVDSGGGSTHGAACGADAPKLEVCDDGSECTCCTAQGECGEPPPLGRGCLALDQPGASHPNCPEETLNGSFSMPGCCRPDGRCGVRLTTPINFGCVPREESPYSVLDGIACD